VNDLADAPRDHAAAERLSGERVPFAQFRMRHEGKAVEVTTDDLFADRTVVAFGLPGAFTPTCSGQHVPRFVELEPQLKAHGIDAILCLAVNDPYVMEAWQRDQQAYSITFVPDGNGDFHRALGLLCDLRDDDMGSRACRYALVVRDRTIELALVEPGTPGDPYGVSSADSVLAHLAPRENVNDIVVFTRPLCSHSERAKELLDRQGLHYEAVDLKPRGIRAVSGARTTPQIFLNGQLIGGCDALERWLESQIKPEN
jgi:peroxiredoxin/glutaredoxin